MQRGAGSKREAALWIGPKSFNYAFNKDYNTKMYDPEAWLIALTMQFSLAGRRWHTRLGAVSFYFCLLF